MRILHITDTMEYSSGVSRYIREVTDLFRSKGHFVEVWSPPGIGDDVRSWFTRWLGFGYSQKVRQLLRKGHYDILHAHNLFLRLSPLPLREARSFGIPVAWTVHDFNILCPRKWMITNRDEACQSAFGIACLTHNCRSGRPGLQWFPYHFLRWIKTALHRHFLKRTVNVFICPSRILRDKIMYNLNNIHAIHVPNFVHLSSTLPDRTPGEKLVYAGRLSPEKGLDVLLRAIPSVIQKHPGLILTVVGDGPARKFLEGLGSGLRIQDRLLFTGRLEKDIIFRILREADLAVLPSLWFENAPLFALEALAVGTPLIAARVGGLPELIHDGREGFLFERDQVGDLADRLLSALGNRQWLSEARLNARRSAESEFSPERHYERLMACYISMAKQKR